jgi:signal transduction histidine kinase
MVSYFSIYAERFLSLANITLYVDAPAGPEDHVVDSRHRHQLFLAFKEALTNVVRHSEASEVRLSMQIQECRVRLTIADNGRGWSNGPQSEEMDGVINMRTRLKKLGGRFQITSKTGTGTVVSFEMPLHDP